MRVLFQFYCNKSWFLLCVSVLLLPDSRFVLPFKICYWSYLCGCFSFTIARSEIYAVVSVLPVPNPTTGAVQAHAHASVEAICRELKLYRPDV